MNDRDREELKKFVAWCGVEASRRAGGDPAVLNAVEAAIYPEGVGRVPIDGPPDA